MDYIISDSPELDMDFSDVLDLAVAKEDAAFRLYIDMAEKAKGKESRELLLDMAQEEVRHKVLFETERDKLTERKYPTRPPEPDCAGMFAKRKSRAANLASQDVTW